MIVLSFIRRADTILNGKELFVYLTDKELLNIGFIKNNSITWYNNVPSGRLWGNRFARTINHPKLPEDDVITHKVYSFVKSSDIDYYKHTSAMNESFYSMIDTLVPVVMNMSIHKYQNYTIFWFPAHPDFFNDLPARYQFLRDIYSKLVCIKRKYPSRSLVNYFDRKPLIQFDKVRPIELTIEEAKGIGIICSEDSVYQEVHGPNKIVDTVLCNRKKISIQEIGDTLDLTLFRTIPPKKDYMRNFPNSGYGSYDFGKYGGRLNFPPKRFLYLLQTHWADSVTSMPLIIDTIRIFRMSGYTRNSTC